MKKLSKSTIVLIALIAAVIIIGVVLFVTMPESLTELFNHEQWLERGVERQSRAGYGRASHGVGRAGFPFLIIFAAILFFVLRGRKSAHWGRRNHSLAILDQMFAEEKITLEEYNRKKAVLEEEN